ncbi:hypothetical protein GUITHDRAFT_42616, partial [Guillardia theta CCMP2712]
HKTRLCREFMQKGTCQFERICSFAHGRDELRSPFDTSKRWNYKTELCANYLKLGRCKYMEHCLFAH